MEASGKVGWLLLHCSNRNNWRLRTQSHPLDPGWETGCYSRCHKNVRSSIDQGTIIFDVVVDDNGKPVVRSAFKVSRTQGVGYSRMLFFEEYYFADKRPIELPEPEHYIQYRNMKYQTYVKNYKDNSLLDRIVNTYTKYKKGERPGSVERTSWDCMTNYAEMKRKEDPRLT